MQEVLVITVTYLIRNYLLSHFLAVKIRLKVNLKKSKINITQNLILK